MNQSYPAWQLDISIMEKEDNKLITREQCEFLLDNLIELAESKSLCVAGTLSAIEEE